MKGFGYFVLFVGVIWFLVAVNMDTSVVTATGSHVNNIGLMADKQNHIMIGAFIVLCGLLCMIFGRKSAARNDVKCPFCAELIKPEAIRCKHCRSELPPKPSLADGERFLLEFERFTCLDFFDENHRLIESKIQGFNDIGLKYLDVIKRNGGDKVKAEERLLKKVDELASMFNDDESEQFSKLCVKYSPWLAMS